jgi:hypothetical protein
MVRDGIPICAITLQRWNTPRPFSDTQVALLTTFADQAVIAVENVRLFTELEARNGELRAALEQQTATSEVLKLISRSTFELQPVLQILVENATRLAGAEGGLIAQLDGSVLRFLADYGATPEYREYWRQNVIRRRLLHVADRGAPVLRQADRPCHHVRRSGWHRHRKRAAPR